MNHNRRYKVGFTVREWEEISNCVTNSRIEINRGNIPTNSLMEHEDMEELVQRLDTIQTILDNEGLS